MDAATDVDPSTSHPPMKLLVAAAMALGLLAIPVMQVAACSCAGFGVREAAAAADVVFAGTVVGEEHLGAGLGSRRAVAATVPMPLPMPGQVIYTFDVDGVAKGDVPSTAQVLAGGDGASCGITFGMNERWLVFATWDGVMLTTGLCSGSMPLAAGDEPPLPLTAPAPGEGVDGSGGVPMVVIVIGGALALMAAVSVVAFRREPPRAA